MDNYEELLLQVKNLISANRTEKALELLAKAQLSELDKDLIILNSRYSKVKEDQRLGVIDDDVVQRKINTINRDLLDLSDKIGKKPLGEMSSSIPLKGESNFNKWWLIVPVLLLVLSMGIYLVIHSMSHDDSPDSSIQEEYNALIANGESLYQSKDYAKALQQFEKAKAKIQDGKEAQTGIDNCNNELNLIKAASEENRLRKTNLQEEYNVLIANGKRLYQNKDYAKALQQFEEAKAKIQDGKEAQTGIDNCNNKLKTVKAASEENRLWKTASSDHTIPAYQAYLYSYPNGKYSSKAKKRILQLKPNVPPPGKPSAFPSAIMKDGKKWMTQNLNTKTTDSWC